jgi:porphobilinogen synthase
VLLFGIPEEKDEEGSGAYDEDGIVQRALLELRARFPELVLATDVCLCEYTSHGHCGVVHGDEIDNDASVELLARTAVSHAEAGADTVCPSDMMDGRVGAIRAALDDSGFEQIPIVSYAAKYASPSTGRSARPPSRRRHSETGAATSSIPRTSARRCASASSMSRKAPTR